MNTTFVYYISTRISLCGILILILYFRKYCVRILLIRKICMFFFNLKHNYGIMFAKNACEIPTSTGS